MAQMPEVTVAQITAMGHRLRGYQVKLCGCKFGQVDNSRVPDLVRGPDVEQVVCGRFRREEDWVGFVFVDTRGEPLSSAFAPLPSSGEFLAALNRGTPMDVEGRVVALERTGERDRWGLVCDKIIVHGEIPQLEWPVSFPEESRQAPLAAEFENGSYEFDPVKRTLTVRRSNCPTATHVQITRYGSIRITVDGHCNPHSRPEIICIALEPTADGAMHPVVTLYADCRHDGPTHVISMAKAESSRYVAPSEDELM